MDCSDLSKPTAIPDEYVLPDIDIPGVGELVGLCVPGMGMHSMPANELDQTALFGASMIVGYYGGELIFLEPMISRAKLLQEQTFPMTVPAVPAAGDVQWPTQFQATYDDSTRMYRFVFSGFAGE